MYLFLIPKAANKDKSQGLRCISLKNFLRSKVNKYEDCWKIAVELLYTSASVPNEGGFPYLVKWSLAGKRWKQYSLCTDAKATSLVEASALLKKQDVFISNSNPQIVISLFNLLEKQKVLASAWAKGVLNTFTVVDGCKVDFDCTAKNLNIFHFTGGKVEKRGSQTERNFLVAACLPASEVKLFIAESSDLDIPCDGTITISREFMLILRNQWALANPQIKLDDSILDIKTLNFRGWIPGLGQIKAMAIVTDKVLPQGAHIYVHRKNIKDEVVVKGDVAFFGYDPQGAKPSAYTNKQCLRNFGWFFGLKTRVWSWFNSSLKKGVADIKSGKTPEESKHELQMLKVEKRIKDSFSTGERLRSITWNECGGSQAELPSLFQSGCKDWLRRMATEDVDEQEIWVEIPGSYFSQIVCLEAVRYVAPELYSKGIDDGKVVYLKSHDMFVVSTKYWLDNLVNWGGCDQDDKFALIFRKHKVTGRIVALIYRTPNDRNEYAIAEAFEENLPPLKGDWKSEPCSFPTDRPLQASASDEEVVALPKAVKVKEESRGFSHFLGKLEVSANPGWAVNIIACWNTGYTTRCPLPTMEQCIDLATQTCDPVLIKWLEDKCLELVKMMHYDLLNKTITLDRKLALSVFGVAGSYDEEFKELIKMTRKTVKFLTVDSDYSKLCRAASERIQKELDWFDTVADELSLEAWKLKLPKLQRVIAKIRKDFGESFYSTMVDRINLTFSRWASCYNGDDVNLFRWTPKGELPKLSSMGFDLVLRKQKVLLLEQRKYVWKKFPKNYSKETFDQILCFVALYQLFSQANPDYAKPIKNLELHKGLEKGSLISHKWLFESFCKVRKQM
jgi:hypothetical protein